MSGTGSSKLVDPTLAGSYGGKVSTSGGSHSVGPAGPCLRFRASPSSFSPDSVLDGSALMHQEQPGQQKQNALPPVDNANSSKRQKFQNQTNQENYRQAHVMQPSNQSFNSLDNTQLPRLINHQHQQKRLHHQHQEQQQHIERSYPPMHQYAMQHMNDQFPKQGNCGNWFKQCMADKRYQIHENSRQNWEQFVKKYYAPRAKIRWCFSSYGNAGNHTRGVFPQTAGTELPCDLCRSSSGNGFVINVEVLSMLNQIKYNNEVIDEFWSLDMLHESRLSRGLTVLGYNKAVQTSVYEQFRVVHSGRLRIAVTPEMKILNWEFCAQHHEVLVNNSQVRQFLRAAQNYQASVNKSGSSGLSREILEASCKMFVAASRSLARSLEPLALDDWGLSKRYSRCLQMSQVANSFKDLMDFSQEHKMGPLESYKIYQQVAANPQYPPKQKEQLVVAQGMHFADENKWNKTIAIPPGERNYRDNNQTGIEIPVRNSNPNMLQPDPPHNYKNSNITQPLPHPESPHNNYKNSNITQPLILAKNSTNKNNLLYSQQTNQKSSLVDVQELQSNNIVVQQQTEAELIRNDTNVDTFRDNLPGGGVEGLAPRMVNDTPSKDDDDDDFLEFCNSARFDGEIDPANQK